MDALRGWSLGHLRGTQWLRSFGCVVVPSLFALWVQSRNEKGTQKGMELGRSGIATGDEEWAFGGWYWVSISVKSCLDCQTAQSQGLKRAGQSWVQDTLPSISLPSATSSYCASI